MDANKKDVTNEEVVNTTEVTEEVVEEKNEPTQSMQEQLNNYYTSVTGLEAEVHVETVDPEEEKKKKIILIVIIVVLVVIMVGSYFLLNKNNIVRHKQDEEVVDEKEKIDNSVNFGHKYYTPKFEVTAPTLPSIVQDSCTTFIIEGTTWSYCLDEYDNAINVHSLDSLNDEVDIPGVIDGHTVIELGLRNSNRQMSLCAAKASCKGIKSITVPEGVIYLNHYLFYHLESLKYVSLPDTIKYIGNYAFSNCTDLERVSTDIRGSVYLPRSLEYYGTYVFSYDNNITSFDFPSQINYINSYTFYHSEGFRNLVIPGQFDMIYPGSFSANSKLKSVEIEEGVSVVSGFSSNPNLREVKISETVYAIGEKAFSGCTGIEKFEYKGKLKHLGRYIFSNTDIDINKFLSIENLDRASATTNPDDLDFDLDNVNKEKDA